MKKTAALLMVFAMTVSMTACGNGKETGNSGNNSSDRVVIYTAAEDERIAYLQEEFDKKFPDTEVVLQSLGTGEMLSKLQAEGANTSCDIFYDLEVINAETILNSNPDMFADLSDYDFSIYDDSVMGYTSRHHQYAPNGKTYGAFLVNTKKLEEAGLEVPQTYEDLLSDEYKDLIAMPSPKTSGTGYSLYNGMLTLLGEEQGMAYFEKLNDNIKEYTTSGSAPVKSVESGDVAIGFGLLWQCVEHADENPDLQVVVPDNEVPFGLFTMGMIKGHETNEKVKAVFDYLYNELNEKQVAKYNPDRIYNDQLPTEIANYPEGFSEIAMANLFDFQYKQELLDKWAY